MDMSKSVALPLIFLVFISGTNMVLKVNGDECGYLSKMGGGCPDINKCIQTCNPCYRGIGEIVAACASTTGEPWQECRCYFNKGAPCPHGPPKCPGFTYHP
ncbi:hypothetical protein Tsubulata_041577 [Turnera subulata]|uniref:Uncharacterized protein n=1 Tax=Turnera subulata TaxID=218843 RepID=A0A9Q0IZ71_9ROSI|nr:hypothetical protein Tsubulata_041577 [Turnera subulata]